MRRSSPCFRTLRVLGLVLATGCFDLPKLPDELTNPTPVASEPWTPRTFGVPVGDATEATLGPSGGELRSLDDRVRVKVPAGALAADTRLTIQPITNAAAGVGSFGAAYRLTPEGQTFARPVDISFEYSDQELGTDPVESRALAYQGADGLWHRAGATTVDPIAKTVTVQSTHFSDWRTAEDFGLSMAPLVTLMKAGTQAELAASYTLDGPPPEIETVDWTVEGQSGGYGAVGTIVSQGTAVPLRATFRAPTVRPPDGLVLVGAWVTAAGKTVNLVREIGIIDSPAYTGTVEVEGTMTEESETHRWSGQGTLTFLLSRNDDGGATYTLDPATSSWSFTSYISTSVDRTCRLSWDGERLLNGGLTVAKELNAYNLVGLMAETGAKRNCKHRDGRRVEQAFAPSSLVMSSKGPADPGWVSLGDGQELSGRATHRLEDSGSTITVNTRWNLKKYP